MIHGHDLNRAGLEAAQRACDKLPGELRNEVYRHLFSTSVQNSISRAPVPAVDFRARTIAKDMIEKLVEESKYVFKLEVLRLFDQEPAGIILPSGSEITWAILPDDPNKWRSKQRLYLGVPVENRSERVSDRFLPGEGHFWMSPVKDGVLRFSSDRPCVPAVREFRHALAEALAHEESRKEEGERPLLKGAARQLVESLMELVDFVLVTFDTKGRPELSVSPPPARELKDRLLHKWPDAKFKWAYGELLMAAPKMLR